VIKLIRGIAGQCPKLAMLIPYAHLNRADALRMPCTFLRNAEKCPPFVQNRVATRSQ
jgi:hypothetical protein